MSEKDLLTGRTNRDWLIKTDGTVGTLRAAALIIKDNKLLVAKSADYDCYYLVGGGIKINESSEEAVVREVFEETGHKLKVDRLAFVQERFFEVAGQRHHHIGFFYLMKNRAIDIADANVTDISKETLHWLPIETLGDINLVPEFLKSISFDNITGVGHIISKE